MKKIPNQKFGRHLICVLGMPGSGKGTQGALLARYLKAEYLILGDYIREVYREGPIDNFHREVIENYDSGMPQTDEAIVRIFHMMIADQGKNKFANGLILDHYPLLMSQVKTVHDLSRKMKFGHPIVLYIDVSDKEIVRRLSRGRLVCLDCKKKYGAPPADEKELIKYCQRCSGSLETRSDDKPKVILNRIRENKKHLKPVMAALKKDGCLVMINGEQLPELVFAEMINALKKVESKK